MSCCWRRAFRAEEAASGRTWGPGNCGRWAGCGEVGGLEAFALAEGGQGVSTEREPAPGHRGSDGTWGHRGAPEGF